MVVVFFSFVSICVRVHEFIDERKAWYSHLAASIILSEFVTSDVCMAFKILMNRFQWWSCFYHFFSSLMKVKTFRELYSKTISDKHEDVMAKFGAILAQGILDAGKLSHKFLYIWKRCENCKWLSVLIIHHPSIIHPSYYKLYPTLRMDVMS